MLVIELSISTSILDILAGQGLAWLFSATCGWSTGQPYFFNGVVGGVICLLGLARRFAVIDGQIDAGYGKVLQ
jgi:hypothetical protein